METSKKIVAIDGPAGTGKSTVAREVAKKLNWAYLDTGAIYRVVGLLALRHETEDEAFLVDLIQRSHIQFHWSNSQNKVFLNSEDVTADIREEKVGMLASRVSAYARVRAALLGLQRELGKRGHVVVEGRDIGTVVFPDAAYKFFLTASPEIRAKRRFNELQLKGEKNLDYQELLNQMQARDEQDQNRQSAPLKKAESATTFDTSSLSVDEVVEMILNSVQ
jgi:cytidylate kinase